MTDKLNHVDLCFVVDTTGSMGPFIAEAQQQLLATIDALRVSNNLDLQIGLVEYRDHPPQDTSFVTRLHPLTADLKKMQRSINSLRADGGGDAPEAVYDGVHEAAILMDWRAHSCRFILLVGDAPPHGYALPTLTFETTGRRGRRHTHAVGGDTWPDGCPCGLDVMAVTAAAENERVTVHALCMGGLQATAGAFTEIARATGGQCAQASDAQSVVAQIVAVLTEEFSNLRLDREVLRAVDRLGTLETSEIAAALECPRLQAAAAIARLGRRGFLAAGIERLAYA